MRGGSARRLQDRLRGTDYRDQFTDVYYLPPAERCTAINLQLTAPAYDAFLTTAHTARVTMTGFACLALHAQGFSQSAFVVDDYAGLIPAGSAG
jgi:hypothetical protein